jgi:hypothetical protein
MKQGYVTRGVIPREEGLRRLSPAKPRKLMSYLLMEANSTSSVCKNVIKI